MSVRGTVYSSWVSRSDESIRSREGDKLAMRPLPCYFGYLLVLMPLIRVPSIMMQFCG